jgi:RNA polymerase sigma factor (sigma-70 family)
MQRFPHPSGLEDTPIGKLYQRYWHALFTVIRQSISSREDAEDILLEVFLAAVESKTLPGMSEMHQEAWLRRVAYNKCMDFHRRTTRRPRFSLEGYIETLYDDEEREPEQVALRQEEVVQLQEHLAILSADQREILRLRFADELPCAQIAARMHKSEGAVRAALARALNRLRGIYTKCRKESYHD